MTRLPLYEISPDKKPLNTGNAGLWYNKFCDQWHKDRWSLQAHTVGNGQNKQEINSKQNWINTVVGRKAGNERLLQEASERRREMVAKCSGIIMNFETTAPFITGLGNPHPVENGFTWHHLFGSPFLPAASIKGLVRDWATNWADNKQQNHENVTRLFGADNKKDNKNTGSIIFLDAIPTKFVQLKSEIMTPHYGDYYQSNTECPDTPGDWLSPTPIPFLAVAEKQEFQFALISKCGEGHDTDLKMAADWLIAALQTVGAGGKTAVGYGTFRRSGRELPKEEKWRLKLKQLEPNDLVNSFSRNWGKTKKQYGTDLNLYKKLIIEIHGEAIHHWKDSEKQNEKKAFKRIFPGD